MEENKTVELEQAAPAPKKRGRPRKDAADAAAAAGAKKPAAKKAAAGKKAAGTKKNEAEKKAEGTKRTVKKAAAETAGEKKAAAPRKRKAAADRPLRILFSASECVPFIKTGGLADVVGALPRELAAMGADVRVMIPEYSLIPSDCCEGWELVKEFTVDLGWRKKYCGVHRLQKDGVTWYFLDNKRYFGRDYIYGSFTADEAERFAFFSKAVIEAMRHLEFYPDVLHVHDWQAAMSAALLRLQYGHLDGYKDVRSVITIHNLRFQGVFPWDQVAEMLTLPWESFTDDKLEYYGCANYLKGGLVYADRITTVSPSYSEEIRTAYYGEQLDGLLRARSNALTGIVNGIDAALWNPAQDGHIAAPYSLEDMGGKAACKAALQKEFNLDEEADSPVVGMVTRLSDQKGFDLVERVISEIVESGVQLAVLGRGESRYEGLFSWAAWRYPGRVGVRYEQSEPMAHRVYAGADIYLMPSKFEPCGLSQLIAMRYGAIPVVRETGGLKDTVKPYNVYEDSGSGFSFANYNAHEMLDAIRRAAELYRDKAAWERMMRRAMAEDFGWKRSARAYMELYESLCGRR